MLKCTSMNLEKKQELMEAEEAKTRAAKEAKLKRKLKVCTVCNRIYFG